MLSNNGKLILWNAMVLAAKADGWSLPVHTSQGQIKGAENWLAQRAGTFRTSQGVRSPSFDGVCRALAALRDAQTSSVGYNNIHKVMITIECLNERGRPQGGWDGLSQEDRDVVADAVIATGHSGEYDSISEWLLLENRTSLCRVLFEYTAPTRQHAESLKRLLKLCGEVRVPISSRAGHVRDLEPAQPQKTEKERQIDFFKPKPLPKGYKGGGFFGLSESSGLMRLKSWGRR